MKIRKRRRSQSVICPLEYRGREGCGVELSYAYTTDNGLIECPNCGLWFAPDDVTELRDVTKRRAA